MRGSKNYYVLLALRANIVWATANVKSKSLP